MRVFINIDTIGEETNLQEDVVIALNKEEAHNLYVLVRLSRINTDTQQKLGQNLCDKLRKVIS